MWSRVLAWRSTFAAMREPLDSLLFRRMIFLPNKFHSFQHQRIFSLLGIVGVGTGFALAIQYTQLPAVCDADHKTASGPKIKFIQHVSEIRMEHNYKWKYVIIGCGTAAWEVAKAISKNEPCCEILMLSALDEVPNIRQVEIQSLTFQRSYSEWRSHVTGSAPTHYGNDISALTKLTVLTGQSEYHVDTTKNELLLSDGSIIGYEKICLASTGKVRDFSIKETKIIGGEDISERVNLLKTIHSFEGLSGDLEILNSSNRLPHFQDVAVIGNDFLSTEVALGSVAPGRRVFLLYFEDNLLDRYIPNYLSMNLQLLLK